MTDADIPQQRAFNDPTAACCERDVANCDCPPKKVHIRTLVMIERTESLSRPWYKGMTADEVVEAIKTQDPGDMIQEFVDDVQSTKTEDLFIVRTVKLIEG